MKPGFYKKCVDDILAVFEFSSGADTSYSYLNIKHKNTCHEIFLKIIVHDVDKLIIL